MESNGGGTSTGFSVTGSQDGFYATGDASWIRADDYEDGNGKDVRSAFTQVGGGFTLGYVDPDGSFLEGNISKDTVRDAHFNGMMDSSETDTIAGRVNGMVMVGGDVLESIEASFYANNVDHLMDNYSLRDVTGMYMKTDARSRTFGGKLAANLDLFGTDTVIGIDGRSNNRQALGYMGMSSNLDRIRTYSWPDITINEVGLFGESTIPVAENTRLGRRRPPGLRLYDGRRGG